MWISINERYPEKVGIYKIKGIKGSVFIKNFESERILAVKSGCKIFLTGDWETITQITHWWEEEN